MLAAINPAADSTSQVPPAAASSPIGRAMLSGPRTAAHLRQAARPAAGGVMMPRAMYRDQSRRCPQCGHDLVQYDVREKWRCKSCQGVLVGPGELAIELGEIGGALAETRDPPGEPADARLGCPVCAEPMRRFLIEDIEIDRCSGHGVWFDGGELGRIRRTIASQAATPALVRLYDALLAQLTAQPPAPPAPAPVADDEDRD